MDADNHAVCFYDHCRVARRRVCEFVGVTARRQCRDARLRLAGFYFWRRARIFRRIIFRERRAAAVHFVCAESRGGEDCVAYY